MNEVIDEKKVPETAEELEAAIEELKRDIAGMIADYNVAIIKGDKSTEEISDITDEINKKIDVMNAYSRSACYVGIASVADSPADAMRRACEVFSYPIYGVRIKHPSKLSIYEKMEMTEKSRQIDLFDMDDTISMVHGTNVDRVGDAPDWKFYIGKFNAHMCVAVAGKLGVDVKELKSTYNIEDTVRAINLGKNPCSNRQLLKTMILVIDEMLGEGVVKPTSHDVHFVKEVYARLGKAPLTVRVQKDRGFTAIIMQVIHRCLTNGTYNIDGYRRNR